jgi:amino acid transporter
MAIAWLLGVLQSAFSFLGFDIVYHISEEMPNPRREGPKVVNMTILVGGISGFMILLAMLFAVNDIEALLGTTYGCVSSFVRHALIIDDSVFLSPSCAWTLRDQEQLPHSS